MGRPNFSLEGRVVLIAGSWRGDRAGDGEPKDAGGIALVLCSEAGTYITGQTIYVDGGLSAG